MSVVKTVLGRCELITLNLFQTHEIRPAKLKIAVNGHKIVNDIVQFVTSGELIGVNTNSSHGATEATNEHENNNEDEAANILLSLCKE